MSGLIKDCEHDKCIVVYECSICPMCEAEEIIEVNENEKQFLEEKITELKTDFTELYEGLNEKGDCKDV